MPELLTTKEADAVLRVGSTRGWQLRARGELPIVKIGRRVLVARRDLDAFIEAHREAGNESAAVGGDSPTAARRFGRASSRNSAPR